MIDRLRKKYIQILSIVFVILMITYNMIYYKGIVEFSFFQIPLILLFFNLFVKKLRFRGVNNNRNIFSIVTVLITLITYIAILPDYSYRDVMDEMKKSYDEEKYDFEVWGYPASNRKYIYVKGAYAINVTNKSTGDVGFYFIDSDSGKLIE